MEIKRDYYLNKLIERENNGLIKIVTGIRRCGKSYLLNNLFYNYLTNKGINNSHIIRLALDGEESERFYKPLALTNFIKGKIIDSNTYYVILDEIQKVPNFVSILNGLLRISNIDIYVTGSNSKFLSTDIVTEFRGRGDEIKLYPLSFSEFYSVYEGSINNAWKDYYTYGGLPLVLLQKSYESKSKYLEGQKANVYINDILERNNITNSDSLNSLLEIVSSSIGSLVNPSKLSNTFKSVAKENISDKTVKTYLSYLEEAFIIEKTLRFDIKGKKYMDTPSKYFFTDVGIRNAILNFRQNEETHIMENIIYLELKTRGFNIDVGLIDTREIDEEGKSRHKQLEIDFVANKGDVKYYIQSAFNIDNEDKRQQEERSLNRTNDNFKKIIIVKDDIKSYYNENGILVMGLFDFLLNKDSLNI